MTQDEIIEMARQAGLDPDLWNYTDAFERFAVLVAEAERKKLEGQIQTLHAMYELASKQRDALMDEQRARIAAMRGRVQ
tara:strand:+ start:348 stop:584 length:237 start_codon:yes stop_codon:yes gene_type:complete